MDLPAHYDAMRTAAIAAIARGEAEIDNLIDSPHDTRYGLTLLARPPARVTSAIEGLLADFRRIEPDQYYYPAADTHLTVMSIISCYDGFQLAMIDPIKYVDLVGTITRNARPFRVKFAGLTASAGSVIVQGFPWGDGLETLRQDVREAFRSAGLQQSIDQRYSIQTAHATVIRFRKPLLDAARVLAAIEKYRAWPIGTFEVDRVELVANDWYQRTANTVRLATYSLGSAPRA
ncbi:2'-5' RNA ligase family protein [Hymenobacter caeli]|uniref:2'-5' RNA ligase n=2 Tax=Hymenobacter caeli TaxID=2735894 RepID=A0ABX2FLG7_9BACT|nr:mutarotase [Hymenobacter caeli]NRT17345.1 2'-5' RNA ligase [Hymenobacter caeli]